MILSLGEICRKEERDRKRKRRKIEYSSNKLIAIKDFTFCEITVAALWQYCVHHQIIAYKNKTKEMIGALIIQYARTKSILMHYTPAARKMAKMKMWLRMTNLKTRKERKSGNYPSLS